MADRQGKNLKPGSPKKGPSEFTGHLKQEMRGRKGVARDRFGNRRTEERPKCGKSALVENEIAKRKSENASPEKADRKKKGVRYGSLN